MGSQRIIMGMSVRGFLYQLSGWADDHPIFRHSWLAASIRPWRDRCFPGCGEQYFHVDGLKHLIMPATNLTLFKIAMVMRLARAGTSR